MVCQAFGIPAGVVGALWMESSMTPKFPMLVPRFLNLPLELSSLSEMERKLCANDIDVERFKGGEEIGEE
jgi:hypothetical protein